MYLRNFDTKTDLTHCSKNTKRRKIKKTAFFSFQGQLIYYRHAFVQFLLYFFFSKICSSIELL